MAPQESIATHHVMFIFSGSGLTEERTGIKTAALSGSRQTAHMAVNVMQVFFLQQITIFSASNINHTFPLLAITRLAIRVHPVTL